MRVLTWNLMHGRAVPPARRDLFEEFAGALGRWQWDVALLQEVPPWWPPLLGARLGADYRSVLTSRNSFLAARRALARRWPDLMKSNGGGCNSILVRGSTVLEHRSRRLSLLPERRWVHGVRLDDGIWVGNTHCSGTPGQAVEAGATALRWADGAPVVFGGDLNVQLPLPGLSLAGASGVDQVFVARLSVVGTASVLDRGRLSDHAPLLVSVMKKPE